MMKGHAESGAWLVTGASSGIGLEITRKLVANGVTVIATGRRPLTALPPEFPDTLYISADISDAAGRSRLIESLPASLGVALLNAGAGYYRPLTDEDAASIASVFATNLEAPLALAHALYPRLEASAGTLALIGSVAHRGARTMPVYAATKAGLTGFGRSLRSEWEGRVDVRVIHPGPTATGMAQRAGLTGSFASKFMLPVDDVADSIIRAVCARGRGIQTVSFGQILARRVVRSLPRRSER